MSKNFGSVHALQDFDLDVAPGQIVALLGPSGCGKTTALRVIAGLEAPDSGTIEIAGRLVAGPGTSVPPDKRRAGLVFQDYALFPHLNVRSNVAYGMRSKNERTSRLAEMMRLVGLEGLEGRMPHQLSGGQQQRVALARTLASDPEVLLLDEPFSNLDVKLRAEVREEVKRLIDLTGTTAVFVTHDQEEAFALGDQIVVMNRGRVEQTGTAAELYFQPRSRFVADFVGVANFLPARLSEGTLTCEIGTFSGYSQPDGAYEVLVRPDDVRVGTGDVAVSVSRSVFLGHQVMLVLSLASGVTLRTFQPAECPFKEGESLRVSLRRQQPVIFASES